MGLNRDKLKNKNKSAGGGSVFKEGNNYLRILPRSLKYFTDDDDDFVYKYFVHYMPTLGDDNTTIVCPSNEGKLCPICMIAKILYNTGNADDSELARKLYRKSRYLMNAAKLEVDEMGSPDMSKTYSVEPIEFSQKTVHDGLLTFLVNYKWGELLDPVEGRNFCITLIPKTQTESGYNEYKVAPDPDITKIKLVKAWKKQLDSLKEQIPPASSYEEIYNALLNTGLYDSVDDMPKSVRNLFKRELGLDEKPVEQEDDIPDYEIPPKTPPTDETPDEPEKEPAADESDDGKPECFGQEYSHKKAKCKKCPVRKECLRVFIESDE